MEIGNLLTLCASSSAIIFPWLSGTVVRTVFRHISNKAEALRGSTNASLKSMIVSVPGLKSQASRASFLLVAMKDLSKPSLMSSMRFC